MSTYREQLQHPNWQRKRLEILELANFTCEHCGARDLMLHVHHTYYEKGHAPWEYPDLSLVALCDTCHETAQTQLTVFHRLIGCLRGNVERLTGYAIGLLSAKHPDLPLELDNHEEATGLGDSYHLTADQVINSLTKTTTTGATLAALRDQRPTPSPLAAKPDAEQEKSAILAAIRDGNKTFFGMVVASAHRIDLDSETIVFTFAPAHKGLRYQLDAKQDWIEQLAYCATGRELVMVTRCEPAAQMAND
jgi:hypothetical protein